MWRCLARWLLLAAPATLAAQSEGSVVAALPGSTRAAGLGGAGAAIVGDAGAIFANPAGLATIRRFAIEGSYQRYLAGTGFSSAAVAARVGRLDLGVGALALDYGREPEIVPDPATGGRRGTPTGRSFQSAEILAVSSVVYRYGLIAVGASGKYVRQTIADWSADAWAGDAGLAIALFDLMALGVSVQNLGGDLGGGGARLPRRTRAGFTMNYVDPQGTFRLLTTLEGQWPAGRPAVLVVGLEGGLVAKGVGLVGRLGYVSRGGGVVNDASPVTYGASVELGRLHFDYAFQGYDALGGGTHRVGLRWAP